MIFFWRSRELGLWFKFLLQSSFLQRVKLEVDDGISPGHIVVIAPDPGEAWRILQFEARFHCVLHRG